jgi:hypothetical protein
MAASYLPCFCTLISNAEWFHVGQYVGNDSLYTFTFEHEKRPECPVCGGQVIEIEVGKDWTLNKLIEWLTERQDMWVSCLLCSGPPKVKSVDVRRERASSKGKSRNHPYRGIQVHCSSKLHRRSTKLPRETWTNASANCWKMGTSWTSQTEVCRLLSASRLSLFETMDHQVDAGAGVRPPITTLLLTRASHHLYVQRSCVRRSCAHKRL